MRIGHIPTFDFKKSRGITFKQVLEHSNIKFELDRYYESIKKNKTSFKVKILTKNKAFYLKIKDDLFYDEREKCGGKGAIDFYMHITKSSLSDAIDFFHELSDKINK